MPASSHRYLTRVTSPLWTVDTASAVGEQSTWLCPTELDRRRLLEMESRIVLPRLISYVCTVATLFACVPTAGLKILLLPIISLGNYKLATKRITKSARPEYLIAYAVTVTQLMFAVGVAMSGGPQSPLMLMLVIPFVSFAARFTVRGTVAGVIITTVFLLAATAGVDPQGLVDDPLLVFATIASFIAVASFATALMNAEVEVRQDATLDPLTGLYNRNALRRRFDELATQGGAIGMVVLDIDHFKAVNDRYGHQRGDAVLQAVAYEVRKVVRDGEPVYRLGGEEFLVLLPGATADHGAQVAERLRAAIAGDQLAGLDVTASFGVAVGEGAAEYDALFERADAALYDAKRRGRDRVEVHGAIAATAA